MTDRVREALERFADELEALFGFDRREHSLSLAADIVRRYELEFEPGVSEPEPDDG